MTLKGRIGKLEWLHSGGVDSELICVASDEEADAIREDARLAGAPRPMVIVSPTAPPGSPQSWGTVKAVLARVAAKGWQIHERRSDADA